MLLRDIRARADVQAVGFAGLLMLSLSTGCGLSDPLPPDVPGRLTIALHSSRFANDGKIPKAYTCDGSDQSPPLEWSGIPQSARALALICDDPDAPAGTWSHWVVFNLPVQIKGLKEGVPPDDTVPVATMEGSDPAAKDLLPARQGKNDFGKVGYGGPCPPSGTHRYFFRLYALDTALDLNSTATRTDVFKAIEGHILAEGRLIGQYQRGSNE
jgi:Raf kinase inhibitor-like YbhB/YbcL family protein